MCSGKALVPPESDRLSSIGPNPLSIKGDSPYTGADYAKRYNFQLSYDDALVIALVTTN
jgi:hypothetical protein